MANWLDAARLLQILGTLGLDRIGPLAVVGTGLLAAAVFLGGGTRTGFATDFLLQLACIPALIGALFLYDPGSQPPSGRLGLFCLLLVAVPLLQLIPLPPWLWTHLPNHGLGAATYETLGASTPWRPLSLAPRETWTALASLITPITMVLLVSRMNYADRRCMVIAVVILAAISGFFGLVQIAGGPQSAFRFYAITNRTDAVGFFANRNHYADLMCAGILLLAPFAIPSTDAKTGATLHSERMSAVYAAVGVACILFIGALAGSKSRAGLVLGVFAFIGAAYIVLRHQRAGSGSPVVKYGVLGATGVMLIMAPLAFSRTADRFAADPLQDGRVVYTLKTLKLALTSLPFGGGMGSFQSLYSMNELPDQMIVNTYLNRAHNDLAEVLLEAGLLSAVLLAIFVLWFVRRALRIWTRPMAGATTRDTAIAKSAVLLLLIVAAHSLLDYPLRTGTMMAVAALCVGLMTPSIPAVARQAVQPVADRRRKSRSSSSQAPAPAQAASAPSPEATAEAALRAAAPKMPAKRETVAPYAYSEEAAKTFQWPESWQQNTKPPRESDSQRSDADDAARRTP